MLGLAAFLAPLAGAQSFDVEESGFQPVVIGDRYHLNNRRDIVEVTSTATRVWIESSGSVISVPRTVQPDSGLLTGIDDGGFLAGVGEDATSGFVQLWNNGVITAIGRPEDPLSGDESVPDFMWIANGPVVAGLGEDGSWTWDGTDFTWLLTPGLDGDDPPTYNAIAQAINNVGQVAGYSVNQFGQRIPAVWENGLGDLLPIPAGFIEATPTAINDARQVVGITDNGSGTIGLLWQPNDDMLSLGPDAEPIAINNDGEVIGTRVFGSSVEDVIWRDALSTRIEDLIVGSRYSLISAEDINDNGVVLAWVFDSETSDSRLAYLVPTDTAPGDPPTAPSSVVPKIKKPKHGTFGNGVYLTALDNGSRKSRMKFTVSGSSPQSTVYVYADDTLIGQKRGKFGTFTLKTDGRETLADGTYALRVSQSVDGVESERKEFFTLVVDTTPPSPPSAPVLAPESDTGDSQSDNITATRQLTFTGTADPGSTVIIRIGRKAKKRNATVADGTGQWSISIKGKKKTRDYSAIAIDPAGNESAPGPETAVTVLTKRVKKPKKLDLAEIDKSDIFGTRREPATQNATPTIEGKGQRGASVRLVVDGIEVGVAEVGQDKRWSIMVDRVLSVGEHRAVAEQFDPAGNVSKPSKALKFSVVAPGAAPAGLPGGGAIGPGVLDVDEDGDIDSGDVEFVIGWVGRADYPDAADVDGDGDVDGEDVEAVLAAQGR